MIIYVLSRVKDVDRKLSIKTQLDNLCENYVFFNAIEPGTIEDSIKRNNSKLTLGEKCCALSHVKICEKISQEHDDFSIILEDDAFLCDGIKDKYQQLKTLHNSFDIVILGYSKVTTNLLKKMQFIRPLLKIKIEGTPVGFPYKQWKCGTVAYSISKSGAKKIAKLNHSGMNTADDWDYFEKNNVLIGHYLPVMIAEDYLNFTSSLEHERGSFRSRNIFFRYMAGLIRHLYLPFRLYKFIKIKKMIN